MQACRLAGHHFFVEPDDSASANFPNDLLAQLSKIPLDGVILPPPSVDRRELLDVLEQRRMPYVPIAPGIEIDRAPSEAIDERSGAAAMAEHLLSLGRRRIGFVAGPEAHIAESTGPAARAIEPSPAPSVGRLDGKS